MPDIYNKITNTMKKDRHEKIKIKSKWFDYEHQDPSNNGWKIILAFLATTIIIVLIFKLA